MDKNKLRIPFAVLVGTIIGTWGVFIFGGFLYRGITLQFIYSSYFAGGSTFSNIAEGIANLIGSSFVVNIFNEFSSENVALYGIFGILAGETVWPVLCTWLFGGFVVGAIAKGIGRGIKASLLVFGFMFLLWIVFGIFAGASTASILITNLGNTLSQLGTVLVVLLLSGLIGGWVSGPYDIL